MYCLKFVYCILEGIKYYRGGRSVELVFRIRFLGLERLGCWLVYREVVKGMMVEFIL